MLKQMKLRKQLELKREKQKEIELRNKDFEKRSKDLETALGEAKTDDDLKLVEESIDALDAEKEASKSESDTLLAEITELETELGELEERSKQTTATEKRDKRSEKHMNREQMRELLKTGAYYERSEVKEFYEQFKNLRSIRSVEGSDLLIPEVVVNRIMDMLGDYTTLYPLVEKIRVKGTTRILIDTDTTPAEWMEQKAAITTGNVGTIGYIDFDGFKTGKVTFVDNYILQDSIINLDTYVTKKIARAIALALDLAILKGKGEASKQPTGIIMSLLPKNIVDVVASSWAAVVAPIGLIDTGADSIGDIVAVTNRRTYYTKLLGFSIHSNASGNDVAKIPNLNKPDILGIPVVFNNNMDPNKILYGDLSKYTLVERESITIDNSQHVKYLEDQTAFRGKGRFDGKPTKPEAFVLVNLLDSDNVYDIKITVKLGGALVEGATVDIGGINDVTDVNGVVTLSVPNGLYTMNISKAGIVPAVSTIVVNDSKMSKTVTVVASA